jgi:predicted double-glycine peptidase
MSLSRLNLEAESMFDVFVAHHTEWEVSNSFVVFRDHPECNSFVVFRDHPECNSFVVFRDPNYGHRDSKLPKFSSIFQLKELRKKWGANRAW